MLAVLRNRSALNAMARIWITGQKTVTGREYNLAVLCADGCAFRIANPRACIERGLFGAARQFSRRFCIDTPGMKQVERGRRAFQTMRVRQSGAGIFSRMPREIDGGGNGALDRVRR